MAAPIIRGDNSPQLQRQSYQYDFRQGGQYTEEWKGSSPSKMITKWNGVVYTATRSKMSIQQGVATAEFEWSGFPGTSGGGGGSTSAKELTIDRWEIPEPKTEKPLFSHPNFVNALFLLGSSGGATFNDQFLADACAFFTKEAEARTQFSDLTKKLQIGAVTYYQTGWDTFVSLHPNEAGMVIRSYNKVMNGQTHYQDSTYSVRHTTNAPSYWSANVADNNVNCIYSTAQLLSELQSSSLWYFPLPGRLQYKISAAVVAFINSLPASAASRSGYMVGWLKSPFGESSVGRTRMEIQGGYVLDQWPLDTYAAAT